jgi:hypothetical protein
MSSYAKKASHEADGQSLGKLDTKKSCFGQDFFWRGIWEAVGTSSAIIFSLL